jgi:hypothetical protein
MLKKKAWKDYEGDQKNNSGVGLCLHVQQAKSIEEAGIISFKNLKSGFTV